jgi:hypothetical protein
MAQAINLDELNDALGEYYRENRNLIFKDMFFEPELDDRFDLLDGVTDEVPLNWMDVDFEVLPGHDKRDWSPQDDAILFGTEILKTRECKVDLEIIPSELHRTWLGNKKKPGSKLWDLPFEEYIFTSISQNAMEKMYLNAIHRGTYNAAGTTTAATMSGFLKLITDAVTATKITPVTTGVISSSNVITNVEAMCDLIGNEYEGLKDWELKVSKDIFNMYWKKRRDLYPSLIQPYNGNTRLIDTLPIEGYNVTLVKDVGLGTSQRMILTPKRNMVVGFDAKSDVNKMEIQKNRRVLEVMLDFKYGAQFRRIKDGLLIVNNQA